MDKQDKYLANLGLRIGTGILIGGLCYCTFYSKRDIVNEEKTQTRDYKSESNGDYHLTKYDKN